MNTTNRTTRNHPDTSPRPMPAGREFVEGDRKAGLLLATAALVLFWSLRAVELTGGDSDQWCREIEAGVWWRKRQMLSFATLQLTYTLTSRLFGWDGRWAINAASCVAGAFFVYFAWRLLGAERYRWTALGLVFSAGFMQLYFGHLETYALPMACLLFFFLTIRRYLAGRKRAIHVSAVYSLGVGFHLVFWFLLPVFGTVIRHSRRRCRDAVEIMAGLSPALLLTLAMWFFPQLGGGEMIGDRWMPLFEIEPGVSRRYALLSWPHVRDWLWFAWNASHMSILVVAAATVSGRSRRAAWPEMLVTSIISFLVFTFIWHPDAGRLDWDLFSFTGLPMALLAGQTIHSWRSRMFHAVVWICVLVSTVFLGAKVLDAARLGARGEGTVFIRFEPDSGARVLAIVLDGHAKKSVIRHVLEGDHTVMVYERLDGQVFKHVETFHMDPGEVYEIIVPATPTQVKNRTEQRGPETCP